MNALPFVCPLWASELSSKRFFISPYEFVQGLQFDGLKP